MSLLEAARLAWIGIRTNKLRAFLTALGVIIGVGAVVALVAVGQGATSQVSAQVSSLGSDLVIVLPSRGKGVNMRLTDGDTALQSVHEVNAYMPSLGAPVTAKWGDQSYQTTMQGTNAAFPVLRNAKLAAGSFFSASDVQLRRPVAVLGATVVQQLLIDRDPVGSTIFLNGNPLTVIGVLQSTGGVGPSNQDDQVVVPITVAERIAGTIDISALYFRANNAATAPLGVGHLQVFFDHFYGRDQSVQVISQDQLLSTVSGITQTLTLMLGAIAGVSLLVGGIGIMNIMLVSVAERTREIGIRKAVGAKQRDIRSQFLIEALVLSGGGGLIGLIIGWLLAHAVSRVAGWNTGVSPGSAITAFGFALAVGVGFGLWPALQAARLDPIEALRHE